MTDIILFVSCVDVSLKRFFWDYCWHCNEMSTSPNAIVPNILYFSKGISGLLRARCVLFLQYYLMITDSFLFINSIYIAMLLMIICKNDKYFKNYPLFVYFAIMFFIILLILIIFSIVFYWYVSSKEYWYAQMSIDMLKWASPRFHGLAVIKYQTW